MHLSRLAHLSRLPALPSTNALCSGLARLAAACILGAALCGCSAVKLTYDRLPDIGYWWLDGYVDFRDDQTPVVRDRLIELLAWHRAEELPRLAALMADAARRAPAEVQPAEACAIGDALYQRLEATAVRASASAAGLVAGLDDTQLRHLEGKFAKNNTTYAKDWLDLDPQARHRKRYEKDLERFEDFYGRLDAPQRAVLRDFAEHSVFDPQRADAERRRQQQEVLAWLRDPAHRALPEAEVRAAIEAYARRGLRPAAGAWHDHQQAVRQENCRKVAALHQATRPEQRERAARRLQSYAQDLRDLAAAP